MTALAALHQVETALAGVTLEEVLAVAELQTRYDRKYLLEPWRFALLVEELRTSHQVLDIAGRRTFGYESVYFDTDGLDAYHAAARGRRHRFKVRTRTYLDSDACVLEVKLEGGRSETIKHRVDHPMDTRDVLGEAGRRFVAERVRLPADKVAALRPALVTVYQRQTLVDLDGGSRMTCDAALELTDPAGRSAGMADHVILETKTTGRAGQADRWLWRRGVRPVSISKYAVGMAALRPELPANKWHRVLRDHFGRRRLLPA